MREMMSKCAGIGVKEINQYLTRDFDTKKAIKLFPSFSHEHIDSIPTLVKDLAILLPHLAAFVHEEANLDQDRFYAASAIGYFIMPFDILPEHELGLVGLLDDVLIAFMYCDRMDAPDSALIDTINKHGDIWREMLTCLPEWYRKAISAVLSQPPVKTCAVEYLKDEDLSLTGHF